MINNPRTKYVKDKNGKTHIFDFCEVIDRGKTGYYVDNKYHRTKVYYRPERTWDDHMGNTPCGYYVIAPITRTERKRVYIFG